MEEVFDARSQGKKFDKFINELTQYQDKKSATLTAEDLKKIGTKDKIADKLLECLSNLKLASRKISALASQLDKVTIQSKESEKKFEKLKLEQKLQESNSTQCTTIREMLKEELSIITPALRVTPQETESIKDQMKLLHELTENLNELKLENERKSAEVTSQIQDMNIKLNIITTCEPTSNDVNDQANITQPSSTCPPFIELKHDFTGDTVLASLKGFLGSADFGKTGTRETLYFGAYKYRYGNTVHLPKTLPPVINDVLSSIQESYPETRVNSCLVTRYKDGTSYCPSHSDDEKLLSPTDHIFTLSVGATRNMEFVNIRSNEKHCVALQDNDLIACTQMSQCHWKHEIPSDPSTHDVRFSLTFRDIKPYYMNSTYIYGDSNTAFIKFGDDKGTLGRWCPGQRVKASRVANLPCPEDVPPSRNIIIHVGINDLRDNYTPLTPNELVVNLESKCAAIHDLHPKMRIFLSPLLPTGHRGLNELVRETNSYMVVLSRKHHNLFLMDNNVFSDRGMIKRDLLSNKPNNFIHLNGKGIVQLAMLFKGYIMFKVGSIQGMDYSAATRAGRPDMGPEPMGGVNQQPPTNAVPRGGTKQS